jgi:hypothetical protein
MFAPEDDGLGENHIFFIRTKPQTTYCGRIARNSDFKGVGANEIGHQQE